MRRKALVTGQGSFRHYLLALAYYHRACCWVS